MNSRQEQCDRDSDRESAGSYFKRWYIENKAKLSTKRKERYHTDEVFREKVLSRQEHYRLEHRRPSTKDSPKFREVKGIHQQVYRIQNAADIANCSIEFIRKYEKMGLIPRPLVPQRYYIYSQILLILHFAKAMQEMKYEKNPAVKKAAIEKHRQLLLTNW